MGQASQRLPCTDSVAAIDCLVRTSPRPVLLSFERPGARPWRSVLQALAPRVATQLVVRQLDIEASPALASRFRIRVTPTLLLYWHGQLRAFLVGYLPPRVLAPWLARALRSAPRRRSRASGGTPSQT